MAAIVEPWQSAFLPPEKLSVTKWAEKTVTLSERFTSMPGRFKSSRTPYIREVLDAVGDRMVREIVCETSTQVFKTTFQMLGTGYAIDQDPGPALFVLPNADLCKAFSKQRLHPFINDSVALRRHKPSNPKDFGLCDMQFDRMSLALVGSNSPANLASRPVRYLFLDEIDKYPGVSDKEASAVDLAEKRVETFWNAKIIKTSTPTITTGPIHQAFLAGDQRRYWVPCPHCRELQTLDLPGLKFDHCKHDGRWDYNRVLNETWYECGACKGKILEPHKRSMLEAGQWRTDMVASRIRSFHLSKLYSPFVTWGEMAVKFLKSRRAIDKLRDFLNSDMGEPWEERGDSPSADVILGKRYLRDNNGRLTYTEQYPYPVGTCPVDPIACFITADVQKDHFWYVVRAWGPHDRSWLVRRGRVREFADLAAVSRSVWKSPNGEFFCRNGFMDARYRTDEVLKFCAENGWTPMMGHSAQQQPYPYRENNGVLHVNVDYFKEQLHMRIRTPPDDPGAWFLHGESETDLEYADHLTAEAQVIETDKWGRRKRKWKVLDGKPNHWLDTEVQQLCAAAWLGIRHWGQSGPAPSSQPIKRPDGRDWIQR